MFGALRSRIVLVLTLALLAISAMSSTAEANPDCMVVPAPSGRVTPVLGDTVLCEYLGGGSTTISVPLGTIRIDVTVRGGGGSAGGTSLDPGYDGGSGAQILARLSPTSTSLTIVVGKDGQAGSGGGFSAIYDGIGTSHENVIAVAGGGGGGGYGTRYCYPALGGEGGLGIDGAGNPGSGDAFGGGGGGNLGPGGSFYAVPDGEGTSGSGGSDWSVGGAGGFGGGDEGGDGGAGYGGGGGGGVVTDPSPVPGCFTTSPEGSGGGAGGSFVKPEQQMGLPVYDNSGGRGASAHTNSEPGSVTLTFVGATYTVAYDANGGTDRVTGTPPMDINSPYVSGSIVTVLGNTGALTRDGFSFDGWNTARDGSGTSYAPAITFSIGANTILYAQWEALQDTPRAAPALRTKKPKTTATGVTVTFTALGPGTATTSATASRGTRTSVTVCRGTTKVRKAGKAVVTCKLNANGRLLRAKGTLTVTLTTTFVTRTSTRLQATHTVVLPRRGGATPV